MVKNHWNGYVKLIMRAYPNNQTVGETKAVRYALEKIRDDLERVRLIEMVYFQKSHSLDGAARDLHYSYGTAKRWQQEFMHDVAEYRGLLK